MIRNNGTSEINPKATVRLSGISTDTKPTGTAAANISGGSSFIELDTGKIYFYNEAADTWIQWQ